MIGFWLKTLTASAAVLSSLTSFVFATEQPGEDSVVASPDFFFVGGAGYTWLKGNELVL